MTTSDSVSTLLLNFHVPYTIKLILPKDRHPLAILIINIMYRVQTAWKLNTDIQAKDPMMQNDCKTTFKLNVEIIHQRSFN